MRCFFLDTYEYLVFIYIQIWLQKEPYFIYKYVSIHDASQDFSSSICGISLKYMNTEFSHLPMEIYSHKSVLPHVSTCKSKAPTVH